MLINKNDPCFLKFITQHRLSVSKKMMILMTKNDNDINTDGIDFKNKKMNTTSSV